MPSILLPHALQRCVFISFFSQYTLCGMVNVFLFQPLPLYYDLTAHLYYHRLAKVNIGANLIIVELKLSEKDNIVVVESALFVK